MTYLVFPFFYGVSYLAILLLVRSSFTLSLSIDLCRYSAFFLSIVYFSDSFMFFLLFLSCSDPFCLIGVTAHSYIKYLNCAKPFLFVKSSLMFAKQTPPLKYPPLLPGGVMGEKFLPLRVGRFRCWRLAGSIRHWRRFVGFRRSKRLRRCGHRI